MAACSLRSSNRSRLISRASLFCVGSTSTVLSVGMPILAGMTASVPYVNENRVSPLLDFIIFLTPILERIVLELLSVIRDDFSWKSESTNNVVPYEFFDLVSSNGCNRFCFNLLREVVDGYYQEFEFSRPFQKRFLKTDLWTWQSWHVLISILASSCVVGQ
ncbi:hypothetical protein Tco_1353337 [Tanacetum coccineum]